MAKIPLNVRIAPDLLEAVRTPAANENRALSNRVETALKDDLRLARRQEMDGADAGRSALASAAPLRDATGPGGSFAFLAHSNEASRLRE